MNETNKTQQKKSLRPSPDALLNPRCDATFKTLFTDNSNEARIALKSFLEAVLNVKVTEIQLRPNETAIESQTDRQSQFDITCTLDNAEIVNIEMQGINVKQSHDKRAEYHAAHLLNHYTPSGSGWDEVPKVFQISVLNFVYDRTSKERLSTYTMRTDDNRRLSDRMTVIFMELPKIKTLPDNTKSLTSAEKWGKFLLYADKEKKKEFVNTLCGNEEGIMAAHTVLSRISEDEVNWLRQMSEEKKARDYITGMQAAKQIGMKRGIQKGIQKGVKKGIQQGIQKGIQKGIQQGIQKGIQKGIRQGERNARLETARNFLKEGLPASTIAKCTGLTLDEVVKLTKAK